MNEPSAIPTFERRAREHRITKETDVLIDLSLDGTGSADVATGVPFLDHMLDALGRHGRPYGGGKW